MPIPFNHTRVTDGLLRAIRYSGLISSDTSADTIRNFTNDMDDAELALAIAGLDYGVIGAGVMSSQDDAYVIVNSNALPTPRENNQNYFRIIRWRENIPSTTAPLLPSEQMASIYWPGAGAISERAFTTEMVIGPTTKTLYDDGTDDTYYNGKLFLGGFRTAGGGTNGYLRIEGGPSVGLTDVDGGRLHVAGDYMDHSSYERHRFWKSNQPNYNGNDVRLAIGVVNVQLGGFLLPYGTSTPQLYVGDYDKVIGTNALLVSDYEAGDFAIRLNVTDDSTLFFQGNSTEHRTHFVVNGEKGGFVARDLVGVDHATLGVIGMDNDGTAFDQPVLAVRDVRTYYTNYADGGAFQITSDIDRISVIYNLMTVWANDSALGYSKVFRIASNGICYSGASFNNGGADLAEWFDADTDTYALGDVLVIGSDGKCTASDSTASTKIAGVISDSPALVMNADEYDSTESVILTHDSIVHGSVGHLTLSGDHSTLTNWITIGGDGYEISDSNFDIETNKTTVHLVGITTDSTLYLRNKIAIVGNLKKHINRVLLGLCGRLDTNCTTVGGDIAPGDLLVSAVGGKAQKAGDAPSPGTILGKSLGTLEQSGEESVEGKVLLLVTLQ